jgi:hypothetical protein
MAQGALLRHHLHEANCLSVSAADLLLIEERFPAMAYRLRNLGLIESSILSGLANSAQRFDLYSGNDGWSQAIH